MKICVLVPVLDVFKGGNHLPLLAALPDVSFTIVTQRVKPQNPPLPPNVSVVRVEGRTGRFYYGFSDWFFGRAVLHRFPVRDPFWQQFDVLHLNQAMSPQLLALKETRLPLLTTIHHPVTVDCSIAIEESGFFSSLLWRLRYVLLIRWQRRICNGCARVLAVSQTVKDRLVADYGCDPAKITIVPNGVNVADHSSPTETKSSFDVIALGSFLHPRKGFPYLLEAYKRLAAAGIRIADVGRRSAEQEQALSGVPGVQVFGTVDSATLTRLQRESACLISTSLYEGFGLSLIEALASGHPAFAFGGGAVTEVLSPIDPHLVVPLRDTEELTKRVREFLSLAPLERLERGKQWRDAVLQRYPISASAERLTQLYRELVPRASGIFF